MSKLIEFNVVVNLMLLYVITITYSNRIILTSKDNSISCQVRRAYNNYRETSDAIITIIEKLESSLLVLHCARNIFSINQRILCWHLDDYRTNLIFFDLTKSSSRLLKMSCILFLSLFYIYIHLVNLVFCQFIDFYIFELYTP